MQPKSSVQRVFAAALIALAAAGMSGCGGGDGSSSTAAVEGVATPSSISVVSAKNAD